MLVVVEGATFDLKPPIALETRVALESLVMLERFVHPLIISPALWAFLEVSQRALCLAKLTAQRAAVLQGSSEMLGEG